MLVCSRDEYIGSRLILNLGGLGESQAGSKEPLVQKLSEPPWEVYQSQLKCMVWALQVRILFHYWNQLNFIKSLQSYSLICWKYIKYWG